MRSCFPTEWALSEKPSKLKQTQILLCPTGSPRGQTDMDFKFTKLAWIDIKITMGSGMHLKIMLSRPIMWDTSKNSFNRLSRCNSLQSKDLPLPLTLHLHPSLENEKTLWDQIQWHLETFSRRKSSLLEIDEGRWQPIRRTKVMICRMKQTSIWWRESSGWMW